MIHVLACFQSSLVVIFNYMNMLAVCASQSVLDKWCLYVNKRVSSAFIFVLRRESRRARFSQQAEPDME